MLSPRTGLVFFIGSTLLFFIGSLPAAQQEPAWTWRDASGKVRNRADLDNIIEENYRWHESRIMDVRSGSQADLSGADLSRALLTNAFLPSANLHGAQLFNVNLQGAFLEGADLSETRVYDAHFEGIRLANANLQGAHLRGAHMERAALADATLIASELTEAHLNDAILRGANLTDADLIGADLSNGSFYGAMLSGANVYEAEMAGAWLDQAWVSGMNFEPKSLPELSHIASAKDLELITYEANPTMLTKLRKEFEDAGFREQERKITYALKRREAEILWENVFGRRHHAARNGEFKTVADIEPYRPILWSKDSVIANASSFILNKVFFDWTCQYGMSPGRPIVLLIVAIVVFTVPYFIGIVFRRRWKRSGLWVVRVEDSVHKRGSKTRPVAIKPKRPTAEGRFKRTWQHIHSLIQAFATAFCFSLLSAFSIGYREFNVGSWISRLQSREWTLRATGWLRCVAGAQALLSVYFLALWILTYFGRPFG